MADNTVAKAGKRKAENQDAAPPKKVKLANGDAAATSSEQEIKSIFVGRLSWNVDNDWLAQEFAVCGEVESAHVQMDRNTGKSRGFGYVHFTTAEAVEKAIAMNGMEIDGRPVNIDKSNPPDKSAAREKRAQVFGDEQSAPSATLFVGNLSFGVNEDALWEVFGFAYVEFSDIETAKKAHGAMNGQDLDGRALRLDFSQPRDSSGGGRGRPWRFR
ncbi:hypothetical protein BJ138DRAFT_791249 [Hygrophoropsis aurantiaca]|uniref:Uncharacterized protein n=1 Tax=Hygrophoropsis aurantiaca TaxID=72124 RepID=A0ACB8AGI9_9AGAM|nr:hypothetical protein BJ138DRAFT_791249 [Hygrophoropsis aurantiaca]